MLPNAYTSYRRVQAETATAGDLLVMLYQGLVKFLNLGSRAIELGQIEAAHNNLIKAQNIISELRLSLKMDGGEDWVKRLDALYEYMLIRLVHANVKKDKAAVDEVLSMCQQLLSAWEEASRRSSVPAQNGESA